MAGFGASGGSGAFRREAAVRLATLLAALGGALFGTGALSACQDPASPRSAGSPRPQVDMPSSADGSADPSASAPPAPSGAPSAATPPTAPRDDAPIRVIDMHVDTPWQVHFKGRSIDLHEGHATMAALKAGHYAAITYPIYIADHLHGGHPTVADADAILGTIEDLIRKHEDVLWDPRKGGVAPDGKVAALISIEGAGAFADDLPQIDRFVARGVRFVGPVHAADNRLATSATGKDKTTGLTDTGKKFCRRVYAAGALVDVSHMSDAAFRDLASIAGEVGAPIVATHSNARAIADHPRNLTDDQLRQIAKSGGVAGLNLHGAFLARGETPSIASAVRQTKHMIAVAGVEHVAIGSDFDGASPPSDLSDASRMPALADALVEAGLSRAEVRAVFEGNARRVLAWKPARRPE